jgi:CDP-diacylglycerol--glycerol-3-phosphate 3-phosphatidyltransferase
MADLTVAIANIIFFFALLGVYLVRSALVGRRRTARTEADGGSLFLNKRTMEMVYWVLEPLIDFLAALHITPEHGDAVLAAPGGGRGRGAGIRLVRAGVRAGGDGDVLRHPGRACWRARPACRRTPGEVIDAAVDRYGEMFWSGGLVYYYRTHDQVLFIVLAAIIGSFMVSYATAKAERWASPRRAARCAGASAPLT